MKKSGYYDICGDLFLVYEWSRKYNRFINTHAFTNQTDAAITAAQSKVKWWTREFLSK